MRRPWPRFADRFDERFRRLWHFYLLSCAGAFRARSMQVFQILFAQGGLVGGERMGAIRRDQPQARPLRAAA